MPIRRFACSTIVKRLQTFLKNKLIYLRCICHNLISITARFPFGRTVEIYDSSPNRIWHCVVLSSSVICERLIYQAMRCTIFRLLHIYGWLYWAYFRPFLVECKFITILEKDIYIALSAYRWLPSPFVGLDVLGRSIGFPRTRLDWYGFLWLDGEKWLGWRDWIKKTGSDAAWIGTDRADCYGSWPRG